MVYLSKCSTLPSKVLSAESVGMTTKFAASQILSPLPQAVHRPPGGNKVTIMDLYVCC